MSHGSAVVPLCQTYPLRLEVRQEIGVHPGKCSQRIQGKIVHLAQLKSRAKIRKSPHIVKESLPQFSVHLGKCVRDTEVEPNVDGHK